MWIWEWDYTEWTGARYDASTTLLRHIISPWPLHTASTKSIWKQAQQQLYEADYFDFYCPSKTLSALIADVINKCEMMFFCLLCSPVIRHSSAQRCGNNARYISWAAICETLCTGGCYMLRNVPLSAVIPLMLGEPLMWWCWRAGKNWVAVRRQQAAQDWPPTPLTRIHKHTHTQSFVLCIRTETYPGEHFTCSWDAGWRVGADMYDGWDQM